MYKVEKYQWNEKDRLYFSSDWHIFHDPKSWSSPIWEMRGYLNAIDAAENTLRVINERVDENSILYVLGDGFLNATDDQCLEWLDGIKCKNIKYLWGNHSSNMYRLYREEVLKQFGRSDIEVYPLKIGNVEFIGNHVEITVGKQHIVMNHFPLRIWNKNSRASWNLSGHSHASDIERLPEYPHGKCFDIGIDYKKDVWSFEEIMDVMSTKTVKILDHHDSQA